MRRAAAAANARTRRAGDATDPAAVRTALTGIDADGKLVPKLAVSWEQVDPLKWRFKLRQGVKWHDGKPFTSRDVKCTWDLLRGQESSTGSGQENGKGGETLRVNGAQRQSGDLSDLIWSVAETIEQLSVAWTLQPGDLIFTGTPAGVGAVQRGDIVVAGIDGLDTLHTTIV